MNRYALAAFLIVALTLTACSDPKSGAGEGAFPRAHSYDVTVTRTTLGIPHVEAADYGSLGYGLGYSFAEDNLCVLLEDIITNRGERARYFGADGSYTIVPNNVTANNVDSDFFWRLMNTDAAVAKLKAASLPDAIKATRGYKDGFNRYIREIKSGGHAGRHAACRDGEWLAEISEDDMYRRYLRLSLIASSSVFINGIATAKPPVGGSSGSGSAPSSEQMAQALAQDPGPLAFFTGDRPFGSNMYGLGADATTSGMPILFGNPHFPWSGTERLYIWHAKIPGVLDTMGSALYGVPAVNIGFNGQFAWSHTVSTAYRFSFYELTLAGDPTTYLYNGQVLKMEAVPLTIEVKEQDGSIGTLSRTLYRSKYGPMLTFKVQGAEIFPWTTSKAYTLRDANYENDRLITQFFLWNRARSLDEFKALHKSVLGIPWVNTVAAGPNQPVYYGDVSVVPHVTNAKAQSCGTSAQAAALAAAAPGLPLLDGQRADCEWGTDADAPQPGIFGPGNLPTLERTDWVHNCNDSYWLTNPAQPLTGYNKIIGAENSERSLRTRLCILQVQRHLDEADGNDYDADRDRRFNLVELQDTVLSSQIYSAELARNAVVSDLCLTGTAPTSRDGVVSVAEACTVLKAWDLADNLESVGGHIWREFFRGVTAANANGRWTTGFSAGDPVNTPRGLNTRQPQIQAAFGDAVKRINDAKLPMDAPMGSLQRSGVIGDKVVPIFGGEGFEGAFTIANARYQPALDADGYRIDYGNSYIQTVTWERDGAGYAPIAEGFLTYSQSTDPANPHYFDFTERYSAKQWYRFPFRPAEIEAQTESRVRLQD